MRCFDVIHSGTISALRKNPSAWNSGTIGALRAVPDERYCQTENEVREYCKEKGYDLNILIALLSENEIEQLYDEVRSYKNGAQFLDGLLAFPRYAWRNAMLNKYDE